MAVINHFSWFYFFMYNYYPFNEILAFFIICVWLIPFGYFVSLSASENMLPSEAYGQGFFIYVFYVAVDICVLCGC